MAHYSTVHHAFITSILELKLDVNTMLEWQRHSQDDTDVPHYNKLLEFINVHEQASETLPTVPRQNSLSPHSP